MKKSEEQTVELVMLCIRSHTDAFLVVFMNDRNGQLVRVGNTVSSLIVDGVALIVVGA
jgi:hypothetical protein